MDINSILQKSRNLDDDFYHVLGCDENATEEQILTEYRILALCHHPDKHPENYDEAVKQFQKIQRARDVLTDPAVRKKYDTWYHSGIAMSFDQWVNLAATQTSMHWATRKKDLMIKPSDISVGDPEASCSNKVSRENVQEENKEKPLLIHVESSPKVIKDTDSKPGSGMHWYTPNSPWKSVPACSESLRKFRNYEI